VVDGILVEVLGVEGFAIERLQLRVDPDAPSEQLDGGSNGNGGGA
jgi:hypothetical protein